MAVKYEGISFMEQVAGLNKNSLSTATDKPKFKPTSPEKLVPISTAL